jgi:hypothetical protein
MSTPIDLYVSSSPDLSVEREVIAQVVAALPLAIGWRIGHTPLPGQLGSGSSATVEECDLYALLLGHDFAAPMGQELRLARALGRAPFGAYRFECTLSPSAQDALRTLDLAWQQFSSTKKLRAMFRRDLLQAVLQQATTLGLALNEIERLMKQARQIEEARAAGADDAEGSTERVDRGASECVRRSEAGRSGRILGREVWEAGT